MYKVDSPDATDFIDHQEIIETLEYARAHRNDRKLIRELIEKARTCKGLTHREAAILLECVEEDLTEEIFRLAKEIKQKFYGNRIVMVCSALPIQLLCQRLCILSVSSQKQNYRPQKTDSGRNTPGSDCPARYGTQTSGT